MFQFAFIGYLFEFLAWLCSLIFLWKTGSRAFRILPWVLSLIVFIEAIAFYLRHQHLPNAGVYNIFILFWMGGYMAIFYYWLSTPRFKQIVLGTLALFWGFSIIEFTFYPINTWISHRAFISGTCGLAISAVLVLSELINKPLLVNLLKEPIFWFSLAILVYFLPVSILMGANEYLRGSDSKLGDFFGRIFISVNAIFNLIHYSLLGFAAFCQYRLEKKKRP